MHVRVKQPNLDNFTHVATGQNLPQILITLPKQREITPSIRQGFFENLFPQAERKFLMPMYLRIFLINILKSTLIYVNSTSQNEPSIEVIQDKLFPFFFFFSAACFLLRIICCKYLLALTFFLWKVWILLSLYMVNYTSLEIAVNLFLPL